MGDMEAIDKEAQMIIITDGATVEAETPMGPMWFETRSDADEELPVYFPGAKVRLIRNGETFEGHVEELAWLGVKR